MSLIAHGTCQKFLTKSRLLLVLLTVGTLWVIIWLQSSTLLRIAKGSQYQRWPPIPRIIHLTYASEMVREDYKMFILNCLRLNPGWKYFLWRDQDIEELIEDQFPWMKTKYRSLKMKVERSDVVRYMALHFYGGVYLDMDVECVKPLLPSLESFGPAFLDQERKEQARMIYGHEFSAMNSAMGSVREHPFFMILLKAINLTSPNAEAPLWTTGPMILTTVYRSWIQSQNQSRYPVTLLEPEVFSPIMDGGRDYYLPLICNKLNLGNKTTKSDRWKKNGCDLLMSQQWRPDATNKQTTVGRHRFKHLGWYGESGKEQRFNICDLRSDVKLYKIHNMKPGD